MNFSTDLPSGLKAVAAYLASREKRSVVPSHGAQSEPAGPRCLHCGLMLPKDIRKDAKYCDAACKKAAQRAKHLQVA